MSKDKKPSKALEPKKDEGFCVYLGPTKAGYIQHGTTYAGNKGKVLKEISRVIEKYPLAASLVIPGEELAATHRKVKTPGNILYENYRTVAKM